MKASDSVGCFPGDPSSRSISFVNDCTFVDK